MYFYMEDAVVFKHHAGILYQCHGGIFASRSVQDVKILLRFCSNHIGIHIQI